MPYRPTDEQLTDAFPSWPPEQRARILQEIDKLVEVVCFLRHIFDHVAVDDITQMVWKRLLEVGHKYDPARGAVANFAWGVADKVCLEWMRIENRAPAGGYDEATAPAGHAPVEGHGVMADDIRAFVVGLLGQRQSLSRNIQFTLDVLFNQELADEEMAVHHNDSAGFYERRVIKRGNF